MMMTGKELNALATLLKLAREERAALDQDLLDLGAARKAAERSLAQSATAGERGDARRRRIMAMLATYQDAETAAREKRSSAIERTRQLEAMIAHTGAKRTAAGFEIRAATNIAAG